MHISSLRIHNYKCFNDPPKLVLTPGFNIICGVNNAGKTALLEAARLRFLPAPHRSLITVPTVDAHHDLVSFVDASFVVHKNELRRVLPPDSLLRIPIPEASSDFANKIGTNDPSKLIEWFLSNEEHTFHVRAMQSSDDNSNFTSIRCPSFDSCDALSRGERFDGVDFQVRLDGTWIINGLNNVGANEDLGISVVAPALARSIYAFKAERFNVGVSPFGHDQVLDPTAANLPEVLNYLQGNPTRFQDLNEHLREVLPQVRGISVVPEGGGLNQVKILVWTHDSSSRRVDLAFPLRECGTGVAQVLAILYVVLTSDQPRILIIDEPQSFLHPGAVNKLIEILKRHQQHQYILATHTAAVIAQATPRTITMLKAAESGTTFETLDPKKLTDIRVYLAEIGAGLADVFGADNVLWVEGPTEELCFPKLLELIAKKSLRGTAVVGVKNTGDFNRRHQRLVIEIYKRMSECGSLIPPAVGFLFDEEGRSEQEKQELQKLSGHLITFTNRRMYENYLLDSEAIAAVANSIDGFRDAPLTADEVRQRLDQAENRNEDATPDSGDRSRPWIERVRADCVLEKLFSSMSQCRVSYRKPEHSVKLTEWLIEHNPESLKEIADLVAESISKGRGRIGLRN